MREAILHHPLADVLIKPTEERQTKKLRQIIRAALDKYIEETSVPASVFHEEIKARNGDTYQTSGYYLRVYRNRADLTQETLATRLGVRQHHLSEMEHNKRPIGKSLAKKLAEELDCDYHRFL